MPEMRAAKNKGRYFRGDEVGAKPEPPALTPAAAAVAPVHSSNPAAETSDRAHPAQKIWRH